ncbi:glycoside hydrolase family 5 protein [Hortaea werneckii]|nr:glycoside hydrolase family 5 protein [Hortaea werneckii]KAI7139682.1 glycoside hydrolase family 5 protein [Hortaea werneckii]KAI7172669.1 glycoside hydrolase family 5 protein [Hortaea werneckii]
MAPLRLHIAGNRFRDPHNREITLHGINVAGDTKYPAHPPVPSHEKEHFFDGDTVSFVDRPFPLGEAPIHFARLKRWGYNSIRYLFTWEALEHAGPGKYDEDFCRHTVEVLRVAKRYGFHVFMDPHQDVWSRFTGGSGAPMWTIYACGLDPKEFAVTEASLVQNTWPDPADFPKMVWATNYQRIACQTIFTMFFAGKEFAPKCVIDGKNIQDYLQDHFIAACAHLARRIHEAGDLHGETVIGYESVNEPNNGFVGHPDLANIPKNQNLRKYTCPTGFQAMLTGSGRAVEMDTYAFGTFGPYKGGTQLVDPKGHTAWLDPASWDDTKYGWKRADSWKLGTDIWAQHGVWNPKTDELLKPQYFLQHPQTGETMDTEYFLNNNFLYYYRKYKTAIRTIWPEAIMLMQPQPFEIPPDIKGTPDDDPNMVFASHFYDGITLITKKWNKLWNVDVLGVLRGRYLSPAFALKIGEGAIRRCFRDQLDEIRKEGEEHMGEHPLIFTEIGIPYDMDDAYAYRTGDYSSQAAAIDANFFAVEGSGAAGLTWWLYTVENSHRWGDNWNGEDLSIYCREDRALPPPRADLTASTYYKDEDAESDASGQKTKKNLNPSYSMSRTTTASSSSTPTTQQPQSQQQEQPNPPGYRAAQSYIRPHPTYTHGTLLAHSFDLRTCSFSLALTASSPTPQETPTELFLPEFHFPTGKTSVDISGGKWEVLTIDDTERVVESGSGSGDGNDDEAAPQQILRWWHGAGEQKLSVKGLRRKKGGLYVPRRDEDGDGEEEEGEEGEGLFDSYWEMGKNCVVM